MYIAWKLCMIVESNSTLLNTLYSLLNLTFIVDTLHYLNFSCWLPERNVVFSTADFTPQLMGYLNLLLRDNTGE
jgi:hypothetical protein